MGYFDPHDDDEAQEAANRVMLLCFFVLAWLTIVGYACSATAQEAATDYPIVNPDELADVSEYEAEEWICLGGSKVDAGGFGLSGNSYPCSVIETYAALEATSGRGPVTGAFVRFALRARLVTRGVFSVVAGLLGLG